MTSNLEVICTKCLKWTQWEGLLCPVVSRVQRLPQKTEGASPTTLFIYLTRPLISSPPPWRRAAFITAPSSINGATVEDKFKRNSSKNTTFCYSGRQWPSSRAYLILKRRFLDNGSLCNSMQTTNQHSEDSDEPLTQTITHPLQLSNVDSTLWTKQYSSSQHCGHVML